LALADNGIVILFIQVFRKMPIIMFRLGLRINFAFATRAVMFVRESGFFVTHDEIKVLVSAINNACFQSQCLFGLCNDGDAWLLCTLDELRRDRRVHHGQMTYRCAFQSCLSPLRHLLTLSYRRRVFRFKDAFQRRNLPKTLLLGRRD